MVGQPVVVSTAPDLFAHVPGRRGTHSTVRLWRRSGHRSWCWSWCRATNTIVLAAPRLLVQRPKALALAAVRLGGRRDVRRRCGRDDDVRRRRGRGGRHWIQEVDHDSNKGERHHAVEVARLDVGGDSDHLELASPLAHVLVRGLCSVVTALTNVGENGRLVVAAASTAACSATACCSASAGGTCSATGTGNAASTTGSCTTP